MECPAGQVRHVDEQNVAIREYALVVDADDVRVVELSERLGLGTAVGRHLECHQPLERPLPGEKHLRERPLPELCEQVEVVEPVAHRDARRGPGGEQ